MVNRVWIGLGVLLLGLVGLLVAWSMAENGGAGSGVVALFAVLAVAAGALLAASAGGEIPVRVTGGLLFVVGLTVVVTQHQVWWWMPTGWAVPVTAAAGIVAVAGLGVLLLAYGFDLAGLSGALGLLALACLALTLLPYIGSEERSVLRAFATALGAVALTAGVGAAATLRTTADARVDWRTMTAIAGLIGAAACAYAGYDSYEVYAPTGHHVAVIGAAVIGAAASLALGAIIGWPGIARRLPGAAAQPAPPMNGTSTQTEPPHLPTAQPAEPHQPTAQPIPHLPTAEPAQPHQPTAEPAAPHQPTAEPAEPRWPTAEPVAPYRPTAEPASPHQPAVPTMAPAPVVTTPPIAIAPATATASATAVATAPAATVPAAASSQVANPLRDRLQTASAVVGLVIGLITIAKELITGVLSVIS
jgi:outer membrane biosynthesis protein TonB